VFSLIDCSSADDFLLSEFHGFSDRRTASVFTNVESFSPIFSRAGF